jgi:hypothetical protein
VWVGSWVGESESIWVSEVGAWVGGSPISRAQTSRTQTYRCSTKGLQKIQINQGLGDFSFGCCVQTLSQNSHVSKCDVVNCTVSSGLSHVYSRITQNCKLNLLRGTLKRIGGSTYVDGSRYELSELEIIGRSNNIERERESLCVCVCVLKNNKTHDVPT